MNSQVDLTDHRLQTASAVAGPLGPDAARHHHLGTSGFGLQVHDHPAIHYRHVAYP